MTRILLSIVCILVGSSVVDMADAHAEEAPAVRITLIQAAASDLKYERIDVMNYGDSAADMTGWRLLYKSASGLTTTPLYTFSSSTNWHLLLEPLQTESLLSTEFAGSTPVGSPLRQALQFLAALSHTAGSVQLLDASGQVVDMVGWGSTAVEAVRQGTPAPAMTSTTWLRRQAVTGSNGQDFLLMPQSADYPAYIGSLTDVLDVCSNLSGLQQAVPEGYVSVDDSTCRALDVCGNLTGVQLEIPAGYEQDGGGNCQPIDICGNLDGAQAVLPPGYEQTSAGICEPQLPVRAISITELLPNPSGADSGNEYIEFYNADDQPAELRNYQLVIGAKVYRLPVDIVVPPGAYWTMSDADLGVALPNTTGVLIRLETVRGTLVMAAPAYKDAGDDMSWGLIDGEWRYSYLPTPGQSNVRQDTPLCQAGYERSAETGYCRKLPTSVTSNAAVACAEGQYRSETTGRCRMVTPAAFVTPCKEGQYRSEETNRCRAIAVAATGPKPCADDQFRNPATGRCKSIASQDDVGLADCGEGRERNPDTHRCRNVLAASSAPAAAFAATPVKEGAAGMAGWWALGGVGILAAGYGAWEWRRELAALIRRAVAYIGRR